MKTKTYRLDRFIRKHTSIALGAVRLLVAQQKIIVDGQPAQSIHQIIGEFTSVSLDGVSLQNNTARYIALHKPKGIVSATKDAKHSTVLDLLPQHERQGLHIVGRLDFNSTGLILLTNDGRWSKAINDEHKKVPKHYTVTVDKPITPDVIAAFHQGIYFSYENITTKPAGLKIISPFTAEVTLTEGRYHQIKRMFGHFQIEVLTLHRFAIGQLHLDDTLAQGQYQCIAPQDIYEPVT